MPAASFWTVGDCVAVTQDSRSNHIKGVGLLWACFIALRRFVEVLILLFIPGRCLCLLGLIDIVRKQMSNAVIIVENLTVQNVSRGFERVVATIETIPPHTVRDFADPCTLVIWVVVNSMVDDKVHDKLLRLFCFCPSMC